MREEIDEILTDSYGEYEQASSWEVAFSDSASVPFSAALLGMPVEVQGFRINNANSIQCQVQSKKAQRWIGVEDLDEEGLPEDFQHVLKLYQAWVAGNY
jgi:hypothetical protein